MSKHLREEILPDVVDCLLKGMRNTADQITELSVLNALGYVRLRAGEARLAGARVINLTTLMHWLDEAVDYALEKEMT